MGKRITIGEQPLDNPHRHNPDVHYRLYLATDGEPTVICVQDFDYVDYDDERFLSEELFYGEFNADQALSRMISAIIEEDSLSRTTVMTMAGMGAPMTRRQAVHAYALSHTPAGAPSPVAEPLTASLLAVQLREHAFEQYSSEVAQHLLVMADRLDGGVGVDVHHGCPDPSIPTAECTECWMVLQAEVQGGARGATMFAPGD